MMLGIAEEMSNPLGSTVLKTVKLVIGFCGFDSHLLRTPPNFTIALS